jgi:disulfide bond formation protein DsbB
MKFPARLALLATSVACAASVVSALVSQHHFDMQPCPWCILQRFLFIVIAVVALVAAAQPWVVLRRVLSLIIVALSGSGVAAAYWQHFVAAKSTSCALTLADQIMTATGLDTRWPEVFEVGPPAPMQQQICWGCPSSSGAWPCLPWWASWPW